MNQQSSFLATEPIGKLLVKLAIPTVVAQIINMLYNIVDRIYIGNMAEGSSLALTGVGITTPIIMIIAAFAALICYGGAPHASIAMGGGKHELANKIMNNCFVVQVIISIILTISVLIWHKPLLLSFGASENTIGYASDYIQIYALGTIFVQITLGMNAFITAQGFTTISMKTVLIGAILNIILDPIFIFVFDLGVKGAALATIISQFASCVWVILFISGKKSTLKLKKEYIKLDFQLILKCASLGLSPFVMQSSESVLMVCFNSSLLTYGGDIAVGAMAILSSVMQMVSLPLQGITQGAQPITSYNFGAGNVERVKKVFKLLLTSCTIYSTIIWLIIMLVPASFARLFTNDVLLIDFTVSALRIYCFALFGFGILMACQMTFVSIGYAKSSILVAVTRKFFLLIPAIYILPHFFENKTSAVYLAEPISDAIAILFSAILFAVQFKKALKKLENTNLLAK